MTVDRQWRRGLLAIVLVVAACGDDGVLLVGSTVPPSEAQDTTSVATTATTAVPATTGAEPSATTTPEPPASSSAPSTTVPELYIDFDAIPAAELDPPADPLDLLLAGPPDDVAAQAVRADLDTTGLDLTGVEVWVWPVTGLDEPLLVVEVTDEAAGLAEVEGAADQLIIALLQSPAVEAAGTGRLALHYRGGDPEGTYVFTYTAEIDVLQAALDSGAGLSGEEGLIQLTREP